MSYNMQDFEDTIPVYRFGDDGKVKNIRPTIYHRQSEEQYRKHGAKGRIGYRVENQYGDVKPITFKQAARLSALFERKVLKIVDWWTVHNVPAEYGMAGYDTEGERSGIYTLPSVND